MRQNGSNVNGRSSARPTARRDLGQLPSGGQFGNGQSQQYGGSGESDSQLGSGSSGSGSSSSGSGSSYSSDGSDATTM